MAHRSPARARRLLDANPALVAAILDDPTNAARGVLLWAAKFPPNVARLRLAQDAERKLAKALRDLMSHHSTAERDARAVLRDLRAYINRPDGIARYPHLLRTPLGLAPWPGWQTHLRNLARERPQWRKAIAEDVAWLERHEAAVAAEIERGKRISVAMPREVIALLEKIVEIAPSLDLAQRAELHDWLNRRLIAGSVAGVWGEYPTDHISYTALDALKPPDLYDMPPLGSA